MHEGILKGAPVAEEDRAVMSDPLHFGVIHGDVNVSNFFFIESEQSLHVFDWDQTQRGWYLWDLAQSMFAIYMVAGAGSLVDGSKVEEADPERFTQWMVEGYESVSGGPGSVDRARLARMLELRKYFYEIFCRTAKAQGNLPKDMEYFINYIIKWFDRVKAEAGGN